MTREEALQILDTIPTIGEEVDALEMAIQALSQEPCTDAVSIDAVIEWLKDKDIIKLKSQEDNARKELMSLPSVTQKSGKWIKTPKAVMGEGYMWYCSECEYEVYQDSSRNYPSENFCPNCGAKMESEE